MNVQFVKPEEGRKMGIKAKEGVCVVCNCKRLIYSKKMCQSCYWSDNKKKNEGKQKTIKEFKPIPKISQKRKIENAKYIVLRIEFLGKKENSICPVTGEKTTEIHHKKGRVGSLFLNTKFWLGVSRKGHLKIENNPEWAKENGFSENRL